MTKIEQEKAIIALMIRLYCRRCLKTPQLPPDYQALLEYAHKRLDKCKFGNDKTSCKKCPIHCYAPDMRKRMREVMRWCGPRMLFYHPFITLRHYLQK